jgi:hypothetical protein
VTKKARERAARAMATAMRVAGKEEGKGDKGNGDSNESGRRATTMVMKSAMTTATRVVGKQRQW